MKKFSIIDYIIIILVICTIIFAFIHITSDDSSNIQKTAFDASTMNKIPDTYSDYYKDGYIIKTTVNGFNATNGKEISLNGTVVWIDDNGGSDVKILIKSNNQSYLTGLYKNVPDADIYLNSISLEIDGNKYDNLIEFTINPMKITTLKSLINELPENSEISTTITLDSINPTKIQEITNKIHSHDKRLSIKASSELKEQIILNKATINNINDADSVLGNINGITDDITIRVYNCSDNELNTIKNKFDVINIRNF